VDAQPTVPTVADQPSSGATTAGKGRPTPKRRDAENRRRGPVAPAPATAKQARARRKAQRGTKEQRKQTAGERRAAQVERRQRMAAGDERYLTPRDKGPVRGYVRDIVDARRSLVNMFMPLAVILLVVMYGGVAFGKQVQVYVTMVMLIMLIFMVGDGVLLGRLVNRRVREKFPDTAERPFGLGWYAFSRAMQIRRMRLPKPKVSPGDAV
jgi:hypothetical protein